MKELAFFVPGVPIPKARPRMTRAGHTYTPAKTKGYEALVRRECLLAMKGQAPMQQPLLLSAIFYLKLPESWPLWKKAAALSGHLVPDGKPDLDNMLKAVCDAMNGIAYDDDSQVVCLDNIYKVYSDKVGVKIFLYGLDYCSREITKAQYEAWLNKEGKNVTQD